LTSGLRQGLSLTLLALAHLALVGLILSIGVIAAILLLLALAVISWLTLWVASIVGAELVGVLAVLEAALLRWTERVLTARWGEALILWRVLLIALLRTVLLLLLAIALLRRISLLLLTVALLRFVLLLVVTALAAAVRVVWTRHDG